MRPRGVRTGREAPRVRSRFPRLVGSPQRRASPCSLAAAGSPFLSGYLLRLSTVGWLLLIGGAWKAIDDLLLLATFQKVPPLEERATD
jgi:hypothetical protein